jgi:tetratricopeptide (TPR) repeat protein
MKQLLLLLLLTPIITFCQNNNSSPNSDWYNQNDNDINWAVHQQPFYSESYIDAIDKLSNYIELYQTCYHEIPVLDSDHSIPLRDPFCCSTIQLIDLAYSIRGEVYYYLGRYKKAIADFNKAIELANEFSPYPNNNGYHYISRGYLYLTTGDYEKAILDFSGFIEDNPKFYYAYELRARAYYYRAEYDKCISDFTEVINNSKGYVYDLYIDRGYCYALNKDFENAMSDYRKAILFNPNNDNNDHALVHYRKGLLLESWELDPCKEYEKSCNFGFYKGCEFYSSTKWFCQ